MALGGVPHRQGEVARAGDGGCEECRGHDLGGHGIFEDDEHHGDRGGVRSHCRKRHHPGARQQHLGDGGYVADGQELSPQPGGQAALWIAAAMANPPPRSSSVSHGTWPSTRKPSTCRSCVRQSIRSRSGSFPKRPARYEARASHTTLAICAPPPGVEV